MNTDNDIYKALGVEYLDRVSTLAKNYGSFLYFSLQNMSSFKLLEIGNYILFSGRLVALNSLHCLLSSSVIIL